MAMAENRARKSLPGNNMNSEKALLDWLHNTKQLIPKKRKDFINFINQNCEIRDIPVAVMRSVWMQLKNMEKKHKDCPTVILSSDDEQPLVTEILDFDAMDNENEPNIRVVEIPPQSCHIKSPVKERKRKEYHRTSSHNKPTTYKSKNNHSVGDQELLNKFKKQIILEELLKRDKEMVRIQNKKDKLKLAMQIEMIYAKRVQKEVVEAFALDLLRLHKAGFRDVSVNSLGSGITLEDPPLILPGQNAIAERLPSPEPQIDVYSQELSSDQINYEMLYPDVSLGNELESYKSSSKKRKKSTDFVKKKKKSSIGSNSDSLLFGNNQREIDAEKLREKLYMDTLIEMALPEVVEEINGVHRLRHNEIDMC